MTFFNSLLEAAYQRKTEAAKGIQSLIQRRIYATRRYLATIAAEPQMINTERALYREVVSEWNSTAPTHQMAIIVEFGYDEGVDLDSEVFPVFSDIDHLLRKARIAVQEGRLADHELFVAVENKLKALSLYANDLNKRLVQRTKMDRELLDDGAPINARNYRHLSHFQLIKALVKLSQ